MVEAHVLAAYRYVKQVLNQQERGLSVRMKEPIALRISWSAFSLAVLCS
jgi:hypothetical protein